MILEETLNKLNQMKLYTMANAIKERLSRNDHQDLSFEDMIGLIVDDEWIARENRKLKRRLSHAKFKLAVTLEGIDYKINRGLVKSQIMDLSTLKWVTYHQNIIATGPTGAGKSYIAQALGHHTCMKGYTSLFKRITKLLNELLLARADGSYANYLAKLAKYDVLIIDDFGVASLNRQEAQDLLEVIEDRHELKSTIITTQLPIDHWHEFIGNETIADAICDRLVHNAYKIELTGESIRKQKGLKNGDENETLS